VAEVEFVKSTYHYFWHIPFEKPGLGILHRSKRTTTATPVSLIASVSRRQTNLWKKTSASPTGLPLPLIHSWIRHIPSIPTITSSERRSQSPKTLPRFWNLLSTYGPLRTYRPKDTPSPIPRRVSPEICQNIDVCPFRPVILEGP
jgi:hypothetical protein